MTIIVDPGKAYVKRPMDENYVTVPNGDSFYLVRERVLEWVKLEFELSLETYIEDYLPPLSEDILLNLQGVIEEQCDWTDEIEWIEEELQLTLSQDEEAYYKFALFEAMSSFFKASRQ